MEYLRIADCWNPCISLCVYPIPDRVLSLYILLFEIKQFEVNASVMLSGDLVFENHRLNHCQLLLHLNEEILCSSCHVPQPIKR